MPMFINIFIFMRSHRIWDDITKSHHFRCHAAEIMIYFQMSFI